MVPELALPEGGEWIVILVIVILLFGAKKLPELTRNAAKAMKEFEKARQSGDDESKPQVTQPQPQAQQPQAVQPQAQAVQPQAQVQTPQDDPNTRTDGTQPPGQ